MRLGVLDVGSNTVHLQVVDCHPGARPSPTFNYKEEIRLTDFLDSKNRIDQTGEATLRLCIQNALEKAKVVSTEHVLPFATSALREASNGEEIINQINKDFEIDLQVLSGEDEARITFLAVRRWFGWSSGRLLMIDIGGGSLEIAVGVDESPEIATSLPLGAGRMTNRFLTSDPYSDSEIRELREHIESQIAEILPSLLLHQATDRAIATSKTLRTLARLCGDFFGGSNKVIRVDALRKIATKMSEMTINERSKLPGVSRNRAHQITAGAFVAESVMRNLDIDELEICPWALREGLVLKWMDWMKE